MKKLAQVILMTVLLLPVMVLAQSASVTNSVPKTGVWEGKWIYNGNDNSAIKLNVESVVGNKSKLSLIFLTKIIPSSM